MSVIRSRAKPSADSAREGYTRRRSPQKRYVVVEASVWNERMVSALVNGVKGGRGSV